MYVMCTVQRPEEDAKLLSVLLYHCVPSFHETLTLDLDRWLASPRGPLSLSLEALGLQTCMAIPVVPPPHTPP